MGYNPTIEHNINQPQFVKPEGNLCADCCVCGAVVLALPLPAAEPYLLVNAQSLETSERRLEYCRRGAIRGWGG
jgi:hypothetical protein